MTEIQLEEHLRALCELSSALADLLETEREALVERDLEALRRVTEDKLRLCAGMDRQLQKMGPEPLSQRLGALPESSRAKLEPLHRTLLTEAARSRDSNAVNGKIIRRSQQSVRELLNLMSGTDTDLLYGEHGQARAKGQGAAIARA